MLFLGSARTYRRRRAFVVELDVTDGIAQTRLLVTAVSHYHRQLRQKDNAECDFRGRTFCRPSRQEIGGEDLRVVGAEYVDHGSCIGQQVLAAVFRQADGVRQDQSSGRFRRYRRRRRTGLCAQAGPRAARPPRTMSGPNFHIFENKVILDQCDRHFCSHYGRAP